MPSWISLDFHCETCETTHIHLIDREAIPKTLPCKDKDCEGETYRTFNINPITRTSASFIDGHKRFDQARTYSALAQAKGKANQHGDFESADKLNKEIEKVKK